MLTLYIVCGVVGLVLIGVSILFGGHDADGGLDHSVDHSLDHSVDSSMDHSVDAHPGQALAAIADWIPMLDMRFWLFMLAGFGTTGSLLTILQLAPVPAIKLWSIAVGLVAGTAAFFAMRALKSSVTDSGASIEDILGKQGKMLVATRPGQLGQARIEVKGTTIDLVAICPENETIEAGETVYVVEMQGGRAVVMRGQDLLP